MSFLSELKRRKVISAGVSYAVIGWLLLQVAALLLDIFEAPDWVLKAFTLLLFLGFPLALVMSWFFQLTFSGLLKESDEPDAASAPTAAPTSADTTSLPPTTGVSVAVLPFVNMSNDPENEYFSDGLSEELLNTLVRVPELHVPARTSSFHFKGQTGDIARIGRELRVENVLDGSVRKVGSRVRISVQLLDAATGFHRWSQSYDRELDDMLQVQDEIAAEVAQHLQVRLLGEPAKMIATRPQNGEAYNAYLRGRYFWNRRTTTSYYQAIEAFREALALDEHMTGAHAGLADASTALAIEGDDRTWYEHARKATARVLELDKESTEGHVCQARLALYCDWDFAATEEHLTRALALNPSNPSAQAMYARFLTFVKRLPEAIEAQRKAISLDPLALIHNRLLGALHYYAGELDEAESRIRKTIELDPTFQSSHFNLGSIMLARGDFTAALQAFESEPHEPLSLTGKAITLELLGDLDEAGRALAGLEREHGEAWGYQVALVHAQADRADQAFVWLNRAFEGRDAGVLSVLVDPLLDPLKGDSRFIELAAKIGLPTE